MPLALPLCGGLGVAVVVDALLPEARAAAVVDVDVDVAPAVAAPTPTLPTTSATPARPSPPTPTPTTATPTTATSTTTSTATAAKTAASTPMPTTSTSTAASTRDRGLEARIDRLLTDGKTPYSAVVVMEAQTGRVLAIAEHSTRGASDGLALRPIAPAASVFKVVTASALLEQGVSPAERVCFHGGKTRMQPAQLKDNAKRDHTCNVFGDVVSHSLNVAVAKLADRHLTPALLRAQASKWGFGKTTSRLDGEVASTAAIPDGDFDFAEAAAGFGDVKISAAFGATLASVVANDGVLVPAHDDNTVDVAPRRVVSRETARALRKMMTDTVVSGTGKAFRQGPRLPVSAAGKTGSLTDYQTGLDTSWFVGFAPAEAPELVVAAVVVNTSKWHIKAPWLAKESLRLALKDHGPAKATSRVAAR
jgi:peptidoglycan glycosyltransferase